MADGNVQVTIVTRLEIEAGYVAEIYSQDVVSSDAKLISRNMFAMESSTGSSYDTSMKFSFEYGNVDSEAMDAIISEIKANITQN